MRARSPVTRVLIGALLVSTMGCSALMAPPPKVVIRFSPASPTHLEVLSTATVAMSGPVTAGVSPEKRRATRSLRQILDVERAADEDAYRVRFEVNGQPAPYTMWLSPTAALLRVTSDSAVDMPSKGELSPDAKDIASVIGIPDGSLGEWRIGESRIVPVSVPLDRRSVSLPATVTLHQVGMLHDRAAARFSYMAAGVVTIESEPFDVRFTAEAWRDLATGLGLKMIGRATMTGMFGPLRGVLDMDMTGVVDWEKSRL